jgi:hypothetical protein
MPIALRHDDQRRWLMATATGSIEIDEVLTFVRTARRPIEVRTWPLIVDATGATTAMTREDVDRAAAAIQAAMASEGPRGHAALIAHDDNLFAWFLRYEARCAEMGVPLIRVFRSRTDGEEWLTLISAARYFV